MVKMVILQTTHTNELKISHIPITQHYLDYHIKIIINEAFTIEGHLCQVTGFITPIHMNTPIMSFMPLIVLLATQKHHSMPAKQFIRVLCYHLSLYNKI